MDCNDIAKFETQLLELNKSLEKADNPLTKAKIEINISKTRAFLKEAIAQCETEKLQLETSIKKTKMLEAQVSSLKKLKKIIVIISILVGATILIGGSKFIKN